MYPLIDYKHEFIIDPFAKNKKVIKHVIVKEMEKLKRDYQIVELSNLAYIEDYIRNLDNRIDIMVHSIGNNALDNVIINGLVHRNNVLNLFYKYNDVTEGETKINLGKINNRYFYEGITIGVDANIKNHMFKEFKPKQSKKLTYLKGNIEELIKFKPITLAINGKCVNITNLYVSVNGSFANVHFESDLYNYSSSLIYNLKEECPKIFLIIYLIKKELGFNTYFNALKARELNIVTQKPVIVDYDGMELYADKINIKIEHNSLNLYKGDPHFLNYKVKKLLRNKS